MGNDDKRVEDIKKEIKYLEDNIQKIQSDCEHPEYKIIFDNEKKQVVRKCQTCDKFIGYPTNEELKENGFL